jgi:leucyl aminopeptidase (aminopeptidase T)
MTWANVVFCLTSMSLAHTAERYQACQNGTRFLSLPDYSLGLLAGRSLQYDFAAVVPLARRLKGSLDEARTLRVRTECGTDLSCSAAGRQANCCPGVCWEPGSLGSPPDAEVNIAPLEGQAEGIVHVDGSIPCREIGPLREPVILEIRRGAIVCVGGAPGPARELEGLLARQVCPEARLLAEVGIGLNDQAEITGRMLEDEGCAGTVHLGFGSNATIGGANLVPFHLDFVLRAPTLELDGRCLVRGGEVMVT